MQPMKQCGSGCGGSLWNPSAWEAEVEGLLHIQGQPEPHSKLQDTQGYGWE